MGIRTSIIVLTLVLSFVGTAWGEDSCKAPDPYKEEVYAKENNMQDCSPLRTAVSDLVDKQRRTTSKGVGDNSDKISDNKNIVVTLTEQISAARQQLTDCESNNKSKKEEQSKQCSEWKKEAGEINKDFNVASQVKADKCLNAYEDDVREAAIDVIETLVQNTNSGKKGCDLGGAKTSQKDERKDLDKQIKELQKDIREKEKDVLKIRKDMQKDLNEITEEVARKQKEYERSKQEAEDEQVQRLRQNQEQQNQYRKSLRDLNTKRIHAQIEFDKLESQLAAALASAVAPDGKTRINVTSKAETEMYCNARKVEVWESSGKTQKNMKMGAELVKRLREVYNNCISQFQKIRTSLYDSKEEATKKQSLVIQEIDATMNETNSALETLVNNYNEDLVRIKAKLNQQQQDFLNEQARLNQKYMQIQQQAQADEQKLNQEVLQDRQKIQALVNSKGDMTVDDAEEISGKAGRLLELERNIISSCPGKYTLTCLQGKKIKELQEERGSSGSGTR